MGHAILYCSGCSTQLREPDFDRGAAFRFDGRVFCVNCAPAEARAQAPPPPPKQDFAATGTSRIQKVSPPASTTRLKVPEQFQGSTKWPIIVGGAMVVVALLLALQYSRTDSPRPAPDAPAPAVVHKPDPPPPPPPPPPPVERPPLPPVPNEKEAEAAALKAREHAKANPDDLPGQLALYDEAARAAALTSHSAAVARERDAVQAKLKALVKSRLDALDASVKAAADREEFGPGFKLLEEARAQGLGTEWASGIDVRTKTLQANANKLFATVKTEAVNAQNRADEPEVRRLTERIEKWGMPTLKSDLARAVAVAAAPKKPPPPSKALEAYRKKWVEAMGVGSFRDYPSALKIIEEAGAGQTDPAVQAEVAADLDFLRQAMSSEEEAIQLVAKFPKGQKLTLSYLTEKGRVEATGTVVRNDNHEIELAGERSTVRVPVGEISTRWLGQAIREKRPDKGPAVLCLLDGDLEGAKGLVEGAAALPDKYWSFKAPSNGATQAPARRLFYSAERDLRSHSRVAEALRKYAALLKDHGTTEFVRRNRALIASRAEATPREFYFAFEDLRVGAGFKPFRGEKEAVHWKSVNDAKGDDNVVDATFFALADTEYRCWVYVGGCCAEFLSCSVQVFEGEEPLGEPAPLKLPSMQYKTHEAHEGRGRPVLRWGWATVPLPKFTGAGQKKVRISAPSKGFCVAEALVSATRPGLPTTAELRELELLRIDARAVRDPSLVGHWKMADGSGTTAFDSGPFGVHAKMEKGGATWTPGTASPWAPPALRLDGTGYLNLGSNLTLLQAVPGWTIAAWICPDKLATAYGEQNSILAISKNSPTPTADSRAALVLTGGGLLHTAARVVDSGGALGVRTTAKVAKVGTWVHVAVAADYASNSMTLYVNGLPQPIPTAVNFGGKKSSPNTPSNLGVIGADDDGSKQFFVGRLSDLRLYNRALSKEEIVDLAVPSR